MEHFRSETIADLIAEDLDVLIIGGKLISSAAK
jgi:hypothetical protein